MSVLLGIVLALAAIGVGPDQEAPSFTLDVIEHCVPTLNADFAGCELPALGTEDEPGYAGWSHGQPVTGP